MLYTNLAVPTELFFLPNMEPAEPFQEMSTHPPEILPFPGQVQLTYLLNIQTPACI